MGHMIEGFALSRGHRVVCIIDPFTDRVSTEDCSVNDASALGRADVAIEFTTPATAEQNVRLCWQYGLPVVCGTTGWDAPRLMEEAKQNGQRLLWKSNFSIGVNVMFEVSKVLAEALKPYGYQISMEEIHHIHKLDKPSGTAKTLAECIDYQGPITSIREGEVPGTHTITWDSNEDSIVLSHIAKGRQGFALGAVVAAESFA